VIEIERPDPSFPRLTVSRFRPWRRQGRFPGVLGGCTFSYGRDTPVVPLFRGSPVLWRFGVLGVGIGGSKIGHADAEARRSVLTALPCATLVTPPSGRFLGVLGVGIGGSIGVRLSEEPRERLPHIVQPACRRDSTLHKCAVAGEQPLYINVQWPENNHFT